MPARSWPAGTASPEDCRFRHSSSFHHISSAFSLIVFSLKSLQPPQKSGWPLPVSQGQCTVGLLPLWVPCAVSEHHAALYQGLGVDQFVVGCIADNMDKCSFCADRRCLDDVRSPRRGSPPPASRRGNFLLPPRAQTVCLGACVGQSSCWRRGTQLVFSLLVSGLSLAPALASLAPVVLRETHGLAPAGKYVAGLDAGGRGHGPRNQAAF